MTEAMVYKVLDLAFTAVAVGVERQVILERVRQMELEGRTAEEIANLLRKMRDEAIEIAARA